jgi:Uma2 family endonuclease
MVAVAPLTLGSPPDEQRMLLSTVSWKEYLLLRDVLEDGGVRMTYLKGALELMSPSREHELWKTNIARLVELYAHVKRVDLHGYGSTTFRKEAEERGAEPDECYLVGKALAAYPEIVIEVIHTAPLLNKLDVYAPMGIAEVWVFRDGAFTVYVLGSAGAYAERRGSALVPGLDFAMLARYATREDTPQALREFEAEIRG